MTGYHGFVSSLFGCFLLCTVSPLSGDSKSLLADAAQRQELAAVKTLLEDGADHNAAQTDGMTALHWVVYHDDFDIAEQLVKAGADVRAANRYGVTPLSLACTNGNEKIVALLLKAGADPDSTLPGGETALMTAARTGTSGPVRLLLDHGASVNAKERNGQTAVMWAAAEGHAEVVQLLIEAKAEFQEPLPSGFTPLLFACRAGHIETAKTLIAAGADVKAAMQPKKSVAKGVLAGTSALILAVENAHYELAIELVKAGADPNDIRSGYSPLHTLSWVRKPNRGDGEDGDPPPREAGKLTSLDFVRELVKHGADVNLRLKRGKSGRGQLNQKGATPFLMATDTADLPLMKLLVELGADPFLPNVDEAPPILAAAGIGTMAPGEEAGTEEECLEAVKYLLELGADINTVDKNGETAMHGAAYANYPKVAALLDARGADITLWNKKNKFGWTPWTIAQGYRQGNFKPSPDTIAAVQKAMLAKGITPPAIETPKEKREAYEKP
jgi:ankyrin repeat protein